MNKFFIKSGKISAIFASVILLIVSASAQISLRNAVDTDADGKADFTVFRPSDGVWYIYKSGGGFTFQPFGVANTDFPTPGDYDGDGKGDISVFRDPTGAWYRLNSSNGTFVGITFGQTGDEPVARDYDGDGKTDIAVVRRSNGTLLWYVLGSRNGFYGAQWGAATDYAAPGDYDGDGKFDFAVQRPGAAKTDQAFFYILQTRDGFKGAAWGITSDIVVPGDYDGDGKTDIAVVREGANPTDALSWYILKSSDGGLLGYSFGATGTDLTVQNDYDGDGKTDAAVWRDTNGAFYYLGTKDLGIRGLLWGAPSDFPVAGYDSH